MSEPHTAADATAPEEGKKKEDFAIRAKKAKRP
jgi:hypothetical protein